MSAGGTISTVEQQGFDVLASSEARALLESGKAAGKLIAEDIALALDELDLDAAQMDEFYATLEEMKIEGKQDLLNAAAVETIRGGGDVLRLTASRMGDLAPAVAVLRYSPR